MYRPIRSTLSHAGAFLMSVMATSAALAQLPEPEEPPAPPMALDSIPVPLPENLGDFVVDRTAAIQLGKALFWDIQAGSDGQTACASCHFHAGADSRTIHSLNPGAGPFRGVNLKLKSEDFPFHRVADPHFPESPSNPVTFDTGEVAGSQGVEKRLFHGIAVTREDRSRPATDTTFRFGQVNLRQVTGRNSPTVINAVFNDRNFWDGRANHFFNGVNPFGDMDPSAKVWQTSADGTLSQVSILLDNASLASQAVGPVNNSVEMSWDGRTFPNLAKKLLTRKPLALQRIAPTDSVLRTLPVRFNYSDLVRKAFAPKYWNSRKVTPTGDTLMEANFSLYWGLSIMLYESTLVSGDSPFDRFAKGDANALSPLAQEGLSIFLNEGRCAACHSGPEFTGAAVSQVRGDLIEANGGLIENMLMADGLAAFYDSGFYNIGVRPTAEDLGVGGSHPTLGPFSLSRRIQNGSLSSNVAVGPSDRVAVDGAFKTPTLRNVELTGPYMHNGGMKSLEEVVAFYVRGGDFAQANIDNLDPDIAEIPELQGDQHKIDALVAFLKSLTDERVRNQAAPFDHPSLPIRQGTRRVVRGISVEFEKTLPATGQRGGAKLLPFVEVLQLPE